MKNSNSKFNLKLWLRCPCDLDKFTIINKTSLKKHLNSKKHQKYLFEKNINENEIITEEINIFELDENLCGVLTVDYELLNN